MLTKARKNAKSVIKFVVDVLNIRRNNENIVEEEVYINNPWNINSPIEYNTKESMDEFYSVDNFVENYVDDMRDEFYKTISEVVNLNINNLGKNNISICDVGCGQGDILNYIIMNDVKKYISKSVGLDFSKKAIEIAHSRFPNIDFSEFDITTDSYVYYKQFDIIICTEVLEHLLNPREAINNLMLMAKENAILLLTVPEGRSDTFLGHINFWSPESWVQFLKEEQRDFKYIETKLLKVSIYNFNFAILRR